MGNYPKENLNKYRFTRHNSGGDLVLSIMKRLRLEGLRNTYVDGDSEISIGIFTGYLNDSGISMSKHIPKDLIDRILVIHDDVELPYGTAKLKRGGSSFGHNGLRSISKVMGSSNYDRLRIGVGKSQPLDEYVLSKHSVSELNIFQKIVDHTYDKFHELIKGEFEYS